MADYLHALPPGYRIEEYELVRVLGSGGFGITYLGYDHHLDKAVAIKEYLPNDLAVRTDNQSVLPKSTQDQADYEWGLERFLNEAQTLARFDHRHIIKIHRFFRAHGTGYSVMEYAEGETLTEVLQRKGTLTESELKAILFPILDGLEAVHEADFLHRDIRNIVIREDGSPVLIDFGSARQAVAGKSRSVTAIVTPGYAPIEQYSAKGHQGPWTDIYGLSAVCYRCLAGEPPDDTTERLREDPLIPATQRCKGKASAALLGAIDRALRVDEGERPQSVAEWREMLPNTTAGPAYRQIEETANLADQSSLSPFLTTREEKFLYPGLVLVLLPTWIWFPVWEQASRKYLPEDDETVLRAQDLGPLYKNVLPAEGEPIFFLQRLIKRCILQFQASRSVDQTNSLLNSSLELLQHELELKYNMLRYLVWLIPTLGFIGTVVGIVFALDYAANVNNPQDPTLLAEVIGRLGVAFYTTLLALIQSALLVFGLHIAQGREEMSLNQSGQYCLDNLVNRLYEK